MKGKRGAIYYLRNLKFLKNTMSNVQKAKEIAKQIHENHKRLSGETYADHSTRVFKKLKKHNIREESTLIAALLHHSLRYSAEVENEIKKLFGEDVLTLIKNYAAISSAKIERDSPRGFNEKYIMQTYINLSKDIRTIAIRVADKADNLEHSWALPKEKRDYNAEKALHLYSPLARIIGMSRLAVELENEAFKILHPEEYYKIERLIKRQRPKINKLFGEVKRFLGGLLEENGIKRYEIQSRIKHQYGLFRKAVHFDNCGKEVGNEYENMYDFAALRVLVNNVEECYLVENLLKDLWDYLPEERDDYIENPRPSGYKAIHNAFEIDKDFVAEVQIKTFDMHEQSEYGLSSHLLYKIGDKDRASKATEEFKKYLRENPYWFKDLNFWEIERSLSEFSPKTPFGEMVYAFTPKGDIIELPKGATVLDFAYAIHAGLGHSCIGAFVNSGIVKLDYIVGNGDVVEIKTLKSKKKPSRDWLGIVKTKRAKAAIRKGLR